MSKPFDALRVKKLAEILREQAAVSGRIGRLNTENDFHSFTME